MRRVDQRGRISVLALLGGGNAAVQLPDEAFAAQRAVFAERFGRLGEFIVGEESVFIGLDVGRDHVRHALDFSIQPAVGIAHIDEFLIDFVIQRGVFLALENPREDRSGGDIARGNRRIDGRVDRGGRAG